MQSKRELHNSSFQKILVREKGLLPTSKSTWYSPKIIFVLPHDVIWKIVGGNMFLTIAWFIENYGREVIGHRRINKHKDRLLLNNGSITFDSRKSTKHRVITKWLPIWRRKHFRYSILCRLRNRMILTKIWKCNLNQSLLAIPQEIIGILNWCESVQ